MIAAPRNIQKMLYPGRINLNRVKKEAAGRVRWAVPAAPTYTGQSSCIPLQLQMIRSDTTLRSVFRSKNHFSIQFSTAIPDQIR